MSFATNYHHWILDEITPYLSGNIAEVGAGCGNFSDFLLTTGIQQLYAFEPSNNMFPILEQHFRDNPTVSTCHAYFGDRVAEFSEAFDTVLYINVLEHIEKDVEELSHAYQTIKPGGNLLIFVPALEFLFGENDRQVGHFRRYHKKELVERVSSAGFDIVKANYFDLAGILPWYIAFVLLKQTATDGNVSLYDNWVVPIVRRVEHFITPPIGKNLLLVGKKRAI